jgi:hypothetical protein
MANLWKNPNQFKIIQLTWKEYVAATDTWGLCDVCGDNSSEEPLYFIALINQTYCKKCLEAYLKEARRYKSDFKKEQENFITMRNKLIDLGCWENE